MKDVLCLVTSAATVACLVVFVIALKPSIVSTVKGSHEYCDTGRLPAQPCAWNLIAAIPVADAGLCDAESGRSLPLKKQAC